MIAVGTSSKFNALIAHRACFCAFIMASSSTTTFGLGKACGGGIYTGCDGAGAGTAADVCVIFDDDTVGTENRSGDGCCSC